MGSRSLELPIEAFVLPRPPNLLSIAHKLFEGTLSTEVVKFDL